MSKDTVQHILKTLGKTYSKTNEKQEFLEEFITLLERIKSDFPWTAEEMNNLWPALEQCKRTDAFEELAEIILFEKLLRLLPAGDRATWRDIFTHQDSVLQGQILSDIVRKKGKEYLIECETKINAYLNDQALHQLDRINIEVRSVFHKARHEIMLKITPLFFNAEKIMQD